MVPLWFHELLYDIPDDSEIIVQCVPILSEGIRIDDNNNLFIETECALDDVWGKDFIEIKVGDDSWNIPTDDLKLTDNIQQIELKNKLGIPCMNENDIYNIDERGKIWINIRIIK